MDTNELGPEVNYIFRLLSDLFRLIRDFLRESLELKAANLQAPDIG